MDAVRRLLDQIEKYRLPTLADGASSSNATGAGSDMFAGVGGSSTANQAKDTGEFGFLGDTPASSIPATAPKQDDVFGGSLAGNSDPFGSSNTATASKGSANDPFSNAFGASLDLGTNSKPAASTTNSNAFGGWDDQPKPA